MSERRSISWCGNPSHVASDILWEEETRGFLLECQKGTNWKEDSHSLGWGSDLIGEGVTVVHWMVERFGEVPQVRNQLLGCQRNSLRSAFLSVMKNPLGSCSWECCWPLLGGCLLGCHRSKRKENTWNQEEKSFSPVVSSSDLYWQSLTLRQQRRKFTGSSSHFTKPGNEGWV